jgi:hypothetical protein
MVVGRGRFAYVVMYGYLGMRPSRAVPPDFLLRPHTAVALRPDCRPAPPGCPTNVPPALLAAEIFDQFACLRSTNVSRAKLRKIKRARSMLSKSRKTKLRKDEHTPSVFKVDQANQNLGQANLSKASKASKAKLSAPQRKQCQSKIGKTKHRSAQQNEAKQSCATSS